MIASRMVRLAAVLALPLSLGACRDWFTDFKQQPSVGTWQNFTTDSLRETRPFRGMPQGSVPVTGTTVAAWQVSYAPTIAAVDSMSGLANPVPADARSLENGQKLYQINCAVCHGEIGDANGTMKQLNPAYGFAPSLLAASALGRTDGYIWGMLRNGRGLMASVNRIEEMERWDVVNYVRGLQGRYPVKTGAVGFPGQTGTALPGHTRLGPTVPSAYNRPSLTGLTKKAEAPAGEHGPAGAKADSAAKSGEHGGGH